MAPATISLADNADNSTTISENDVGNSKRWGSAF